MVGGDLLFGTAASLDYPYQVDMRSRAVHAFEDRTSAELWFALHSTATRLTLNSATVFMVLRKKTRGGSQ